MKMRRDIEALEGKFDYTPAMAGKPCKTWYKIYGDIHSGICPLLVAHGGPGVPHNYLLSLTDLAAPPYNVPIIFYDQIGCGNSAHLPEKSLDWTFWKEQLFLDELAGLIKHLGIDKGYHYIGHSWGGMLGSMHAARQPMGLKSLVLISSPASMDLWVKAYKQYRDQMPSKYREILMRHIELGEKLSPDYQEALDAFYAKHVVTVHPLPELVAQAFSISKEDKTPSVSS
jgi:proline-specific peptidase